MSPAMTTVTRARLHFKTIPDAARAYLELRLEMDALADRFVGDESGYNSAVSNVQAALTRITDKIVRMRAVTHADHAARATVVRSFPDYEFSEGVSDTDFGRLIAALVRDMAVKPATILASEKSCIKNATLSALT